jgi:hypothetical protein
MSNKF